MYQIILILFLIAAITWIIRLVKKGLLDKKSSTQVMTESYNAFLDRLQSNRIRKGATIRMLSYQLTLAFTALLALSAFLPVILTGNHLSGFPLILHVTLAPLFCISLAVLAIFWAHAHRFTAKDRMFLKDQSFARIFSSGEISDVWQKIIFWLFLVMAVPAILSIVFSMYPIFGPTGQEILLQIHRYATLLLFSLGLIHVTGLLIQSRPSLQQEKSKK